MKALVAGVGNVFLGDDGFGPAVIRRLHGRSFPPGTRVEDFGIRGIHLAYELLEPLDLLVIVDAVGRGDKPGALFLIEAETATGLALGAGDPHGMDLSAVFALVRGMGGTMPPTYVVGCQPEDLSERMGLSPKVAAAVDRAADWVEEIVWQKARRATGVAGQMEK